MRNLSGYEKETIITWNEAEATAHIFTYSRSWQRHLEGKLGLHPEADNGCGGKEYQLDKRLIRLPQPKRRLSEATKQRLADNLAASRKGDLAAQNPQYTGKIGREKQWRIAQHLWSIAQVKFATGIRILAVE